jgi:hypothetical protein
MSVTLEAAYAASEHRHLKSSYARMVGGRLTGTELLKIGRSAFDVSL